MHSFQSQQGNAPPFHVPPVINPPPRIFGGVDPNGSPSSPNFRGGPFFADDQGGSLDESSEAKRRRIARVRNLNPYPDHPEVDHGTTGLRHVPKKEDQM